MQFKHKNGFDEDVEELRENIHDALRGKFIWKLADIEVNGKEKISEIEIVFTEILIKCCAR